MPTRLRLILRDAISTLEASLSYYWPASHENELDESTPLLHLGHAMNSNGYRTLSHVPLVGGGIAPLVGIQGTDRLIVACAGQRLSDADGARDLIDDITRLIDARFPTRWGHMGRGYESLACFLATTSNPDIREWWVDDHRDPRPARCRSDAWDELGHHLAEMPAVGAYTTSRHPDYSGHSLLYAVTDAPSGYQ